MNDAAASKKRDAVLTSPVAYFRALFRPPGRFVLHSVVPLSKLNRERASQVALKIPSNVGAVLRLVAFRANVIEN